MHAVVAHGPGEDTVPEGANSSTAGNSDTVANAQAPSTPEEVLASIPASAYWGPQTERARHNFTVTGISVASHPGLVTALAQVKQAAARANVSLGLIADWKADAVERACQEIIDGGLRDQFPVDVLQGGAGTSTNMNANEVIANRALELAERHGEGACIHPIDDVNRSQSTNDVYPTAVKLAVAARLVSAVGELRALSAAFDRKGDQFDSIPKMGRTQLQDAVPMTLGQEFHGFASTLAADAERLDEALPLLYEVNLGGTAIGTGITTDPRYRQRVLTELARITGCPIRGADDLVAATSDPGAFLTCSAALKRAAVKLSKISNDLRLLASGPQAGLHEIDLPARQAGSSIMPGKVNPVIPEAVNQIAFTIVGADLTVTLAAEAGQLQLNAFEPVIAHSLLTALGIFEHGCRMLRLECVDGITANTARLTRMVSDNVGAVTALTPHIGYSAAARIARAALASGRPLAELVVAEGLMTSDEVSSALSQGRGTTRVSADA